MAVVYEVLGHRRSRIVCTAALAGMASAGLKPRRVWEHDYSAPDDDLAFFYGLSGKNVRMFADYRASGRKVIYADLGYFGRREGGRWSGYHKLTVNDRHPTNYYRKRKHDPSRFLMHKLSVMPWQTGSCVIVAGMSDKGAEAEGYEPSQWERWAIAEIRKHTDRPIVYRPKPSWRGAPALDGAAFQVGVPLSKALQSAHAVVCHHSNVAVEAILAGVPAFVWGGVAQEMGLQNLSRIETPHRPDDRQEWAHALAWTQWSVAELATARPWLHLKNEGVI